MSVYLLDTHVIIWLATDPERVPRSVRSALTDADDIAVSAASGYEIAHKARLGRLPHGERLLARWPHLLDALFASELPLSFAHMQHAGRLDWAHRDPFDRMLVAQAHLNGMLLVTKDERIHAFPEVTCTAWQ